MKSLKVGEDNKSYGEIRSTYEKNISHLSAAGSKKTQLCYSKVNILVQEFSKKMCLFYPSNPLSGFFKTTKNIFHHKKVINNNHLRRNSLLAQRWVEQDLFVCSSPYTVNDVYDKQ